MSQEHKVTHVNVVYSTNFNGCALFDQEENDLYDLEVGEKVCNAITSHAIDDCDEDGYFCGSEKNLKEFCIKAVKEHFGDDVTVEVEFDRVST